MITAVHSLARLQSMALALGLEVSENATKNELVTQIQAHHLRALYPSGAPAELEFLASVKSLMSPAPFWKTDTARRKQLLHSRRYAVQEKIDGVRSLLCFISPDLRANKPYFSSRNVSVKNFLPEDYYPGVEAYLPARTRQSFRFLPDRFALDVEWVPSRMEFFAFDLIYLNSEWKVDVPYHVRHRLLEQQVANLRHIGFPISVLRPHLDQREKFTRSVLEDPDREGVVFKATDSLYLLNTFNSFHTRWVKLKKPEEISPIPHLPGSDTFEGYITGSGPSHPNKSLGKLVGSLQLSALAPLPDGSFSPREIVSLYLLPREVRERVTLPTTPPALRPEFLGQVVEFSASPPTLRSRRYLKPRFIKFRPDRSPDSCFISSDDASFFIEHGVATFLPPFS